MGSQMWCVCAFPDVVLWIPRRTPMRLHGLPDAQKTCGCVSTPTPGLFAGLFVWGTRRFAWDTRRFAWGRKRASRQLLVFLLAFLRGARDISRGARDGPLHRNSAVKNNVILACGALGYRSRHMSRHSFWPASFRPASFRPASFRPASFRPAYIGHMSRHRGPLGYNGGSGLY